MQWSGWIFFGFTVLMLFALVMAVIYYFSPKRKSMFENPKYRMLEDEADMKHPDVDTKNDDKPSA